MRVRQNHHHCEIPQEQEQQQLGELFIPPRPPPPHLPPRRLRQRGRHPVFGDERLPRWKAASSSSARF